MKILYVITYVFQQKKKRKWSIWIANILITSDLKLEFNTIAINLKY